MILYSTLFISGLAFAFTDVYTDNFEKPIKPFSCAPCMSFWFGLIGAAILQEPYLLFIPYLFTKLSSKFLWS